MENQSIAVDTVTGATLTSQAILTGATQALKEAGADLSGFSQAAAKSTATEEYETQLVIVGAGVGWTQGYAWTSGAIAAKHIIEQIQ